MENLRINWVSVALTVRILKKLLHILAAAIKITVTHDLSGPYFTYKIFY